jgi:hypothetical protein
MIKPTHRIFISTYVYKLGKNSEPMIVLNRVEQIDIPNEIGFLTDLKIIFKTLWGITFK